MRTAMAAGVLALALGGGIPAIAIVPVSAARASAVTLMDDCDHGGLLGTVTGGVCRVVDDVVHGLGNGVSPSSPAPPRSGERAENTETAETSTDVQETPAEAETPAPAASASKHPSGKRPPATHGNGRGKSSDDPQTPRPAGSTDACGSAATSSACADSSVAPLVEEPEMTEETARPEASPSPTPSPSATPSASPSRREDVAPARKSPVPVPTDRLPPLETSPPDTGMLTTDVGEPASSPSPSPVVDAEAPRVELLWPAPVMQELQRQMPSERPVTPSRSSDTASTVLSTVVLVSAILAVRLLYSRRTVRESIPFDPAPPGHHRVA
ncbi:hypothetical protein ACSDR0_07910 [Streptosporangium sp. G11]|uniref:hypothetical protein n=1 Tax=Streptosporangium sp. G11 TaxID=3436926 RepID=UPI003EBAC423